MNLPVRPGPYPELTVPAVIVGYVVGAVITVSVGYASLILGFSIEGSELAAILGFGILRGGLKRSSIVENNINQTIASSVNGASAGMMFSVPALYILKVEAAVNPVLLVLGCIAGGVLGIAFVIPLRKQMIDFNRLAFPGGIAVAAILKSPGAGMRKATVLLTGVGLSAFAHFLSLSLEFEDWNLGELLGLPQAMNGVWYVSLLTVGVGYIAGRGGIYFLIGGFLCYWGVVPAMIGLGEITADTSPGLLRGQLFRPLGIGMLVGGALTGILLALPLVWGAIRSLQKSSRSAGSAEHERDELPVRLLYGAVVLAFLLLLYIASTSVEGIGWGRGALMALAGTLWIWMAGVVLSECIGRTNWSPLSGMTLIGITVLLGVVSIGSELGRTESIVAAVLVGAAMCVAMAQATDLMLDLKTGYLVGALPRKQQLGQLLGTWLGPLLIIGLIVLLHEAHGMGSEKLPAPQGAALASVIESLLDQNVPLEKYGAGAALGALLSLSGIGGLGVLVGLGFYLPFHIVLTYSLGTLIRLTSERRFGRSFAESTGIPFAAGLIVGEALVGVGFAVKAIFFPEATP